MKYYSIKRGATEKFSIKNQHTMDTNQADTSISYIMDSYINAGLVDATNYNEAFSNVKALVNLWEEKLIEAQNTQPIVHEYFTQHIVIHAHIHIN